MPTAKRSQNMLPVGVSPALDNSFVQAAIILAAGVLPLAITLLLTQPGRQAGPTVQQVAAQPPSAPNPNSAQPKTEPPQKAPDRSSPPVPPSANAVAADAQTTNKASPPESPKTPAPLPVPLPLDASAPNDVPPAAEPSSRQFYLCAWRHYRRGIEQFEQGAYAAAVGEFTEAIRFKPDSAPSFHWRAIAFIELGRLDAALDDMNRSISFRPSDPVARHARAAVFERLQRYQEARADMVDTLRFSPRNHAYLTYLARLQTKIDALPASIAAVRPTPPWEERVLKLTNMGRHSYWRFVQ